ncbi:hypothetical protein PCK2_001039, partial [Pneumocystis canis]
MDEIMHTEDDNDTEMKLALLISVFPDNSPEILLEKLVENDGSVENTVKMCLNSCFKKKCVSKKLKKQRKIDEFIEKHEDKRECPLLNKQELSKVSWPIKMQWDSSIKTLKRKNRRVLHLYLSEQIGTKVTPCTLICNVLPQNLANSLLLEMLEESKTWKRNEFRLFERNIVSPCKSCYYFSFDEKDPLEPKFFHNGSEIKDIRVFPKEMNVVQMLVKDIVNKAISGREHSEYEHHDEWNPNFVVANLYKKPNILYANAKENVGYHSDQLTHI